MSTRTSQKSRGGGRVMLELKPLKTFGKTLSSLPRVQRSEFSHELSVPRTHQTLGPSLPPPERMSPWEWSCHLLSLGDIRFFLTVALPL